VSKPNTHHKLHTTGIPVGVPRNLDVVSQVNLACRQMQLHSMENISSSVLGVFRFFVTTLLRKQLSWNSKWNSEDIIILTCACLQVFNVMYKLGTLGSLHFTELEQPYGFFLGKFLFWRDKNGHEQPQIRFGYC
jgi:hypothetical protein